MWARCLYLYAKHRGAAVSKQKNWNTIFVLVSVSLLWNNDEEIDQFFLGASNPNLRLVISTTLGLDSSSHDGQTSLVLYGQRFFLTNSFIIYVAFSYQFNVKRLMVYRRIVSSSGRRSRICRITVFDESVSLVVVRWGCGSS